MLQALSDAHTYLFEERERLLQLQAAHDDLKLQEVEDRRRIQHLLALHSPMEQEITYSRCACMQRLPGNRRAVPCQERYAARDMHGSLELEGLTSGGYAVPACACSRIYLRLAGWQPACSDVCCGPAQPHRDRVQQVVKL